MFGERAPTISSSIFALGDWGVNARFAKPRRRRGEWRSPTSTVSALIRRRGAIPADLARDLRVFPVKLDRGTLWLATDEPDFSGLQRVKEATGLRVIPVMCVPKALDKALARLE